MKKFTLMATLFVALLTTSVASAQQYSVAIPDALVPFSNSNLILGVEFGSGDMQFSLSFASAIPEKMTLPEKPADLDDDWEDQNAQGPNRCTYKHKTTGLVIHFDKGVPGKPDWAGKDHWHIENPNWKKSDGKKKNKLVDKDGIPVNKGSEKSHIPPGTEVTLPKKNNGTSDIGGTDAATMGAAL